MPAYWEPGTQYDLGDVVQYEGSDYKIIQAHRSQGDWTPPVTPALWGKVHGHSNDHSGACKHDKHRDDSNNYGENTTGNKDESFGEKVGRTYHEHEKEAKIAGGVAAGAALLGAAGLAYKHHHDQGKGGEVSQEQEHGFMDNVKHFGQDHKKELEIGGGLLAAGAALAGGYAAYEHHKKKEEYDEE